MDYKKLNNYTGWFIFLIATFTYIATLEPTTSLWDCGEYITTAYKLEVGHPPGAPLFMMLGRLFTVFAGPETAAYMVNLMSALSSSFTILFLFWSITMIAKKITLTDDGKLFSSDEATKPEKKSLSKGQMFAIVGSGFIGALAYTFTDSFWFSAVEGEVYAMSSFFTAIVVWAILKWEAELTDQENEPENEDLQSKNVNRWIIFIFFMIGLSIGVHLLNLLCIPAIAYIIYFKKFKKPDVVGFIVTGVIGIAVLGIVQAIVIPKTIQVAGFFERFFTNNLGMPFNSGAIFFFLFISALIVGLILFSKKSNNYVVNTVTWSFSMILIGYTCFSMIVIRSNANTPLDENDPENLVSLESYLKREQYGDWPILYGQYFNADYLRDANGNPDYKNWGDRSDVYLKRWVVQANNGNTDVEGFVNKEDADALAATTGGKVVQKYYKTYDGKGQKPTYEKEKSGFLPRMYSSEPRHVRGYIDWSGANASKKPTFGQNLAYLGNYQIGWMYWRYFMWNFAGRQNDEQGHGGSKNGNWISGLNFIDQHHVGDQTNAPSIITNNSSHNKFYLLPLILGLIGFIFTIMKGSKSWWFIMLLFLLTGFAVILYLNQKPMEPRERDYAYAASFYAFSFWIGLSVLGLYDAYKNMKWKDLGIITAVLVGFSVILFAGGPTGGTAMLYMSFVIVALFAVMIAMRNGIKNEMQSAIFATLLCLPVPILMGMQGWDDHDRSGRYTAQALAENYLNSCTNNSIIFTNGDNDTFPLWYLQEVEGKKTSVRVCNLSLLNTDWYTGQMKNRAYDSDPLPISFNEHEYRQYGSFDQLPVYGTSDLTMRSATLSAQDEKLVMDKIKYNPELFASGFKAAADNLYAILSRSALSQSQPALVQTINGFNENGTYKAFRKFIFDLLEKGQGLGLTQEELQGVQNTLIQFNASFDYLPVKYVMDYLHNPKNEFNINQNKFFVFPTKGLILDVDKEKIASLVGTENEVVSAEYLDRVVDQMRWKLPKSRIFKADLMILDMVAHFNWDRNIYFAGSAATDTYLGLQSYFLDEGLVYKLVPVKVNKSSNPYTEGEVNKEELYQNMLVDYKWGNMEKEGILVDYYTRRHTTNYRIKFYVLADAYAQDYQANKQKLSYLEQIMSQNTEGQSRDSIPTPLGVFVFGEIPDEIARTKKQLEADKQKATEVLDKAFEVMPHSQVPFGRIIPQYVATYYAVENFEKGNRYASQLLDLYAEEMEYFTSIDPKFAGNMFQDAYGIYRSIFSIYQMVGVDGADEALVLKAEDMVLDYMQRIQQIKWERGNRQMYEQTFGGFFKQIQGFMMQQPQMMQP